MTRLLILTILITGQTAFGQQKQPTKNQLLKIFRSSIQQDSRSKIDIGSNPWYICNRDSSFFKSDTIYLFNNINYFYKKNNCCDLVVWTFYKTKSFIQSENQICREPATAKVTTNNDFYSLTLSNRDNLLILKIFQQGKIIDEFFAPEIKNVDIVWNGQKSNRITLVRQK